MAAGASVVRRKKSNVVRILLRFTSGIFQLLANVAFYVIVVIFVIKASDYSYNFAYQIFGDVACDEEPGRDVKVQILKGESTMNIASKLETAKLVVDKYSFYVKVKIADDDIMPGVFELNTAMNYDEIMDVITNYENSLIKDETTVDEQEGGEKKDTEDKSNSKDEEKSGSSKEGEEGTSEDKLGSAENGTDGTDEDTADDDEGDDTGE